MFLRDGKRQQEIVDFDVSIILFLCVEFVINLEISSIYSMNFVWGDLLYSNAISQTVSNQSDNKLDFWPNSVQNSTCQYKLPKK
jgi:hypothetical protein